jgi:PKD repeat protein
VAERTAPPCSAGFVAAKPIVVNDGIEVRFTDQSTGAIDTWEWDFESDGSIDSTERSPVHTYSGYGPYSVTLSVSGRHCEDTLTRADCVYYAPQPEARFNAVPVSGQVPRLVQFTDTSTGAIDRWEWDFNGDGITDSTERNPTHTYTQANTYTVSLTVMGPGGTDTEISTGLLTFSLAPTPTPMPSQCRADFVADPTVGEGYTWVQFTDLSTGTGIFGWEWDLDGDGKTDSTARNPSKLYRSDGDYTVTLTVVAPGCTDTEMKTDYIHIAGCPT